MQAQHLNAAVEMRAWRPGGDHDVHARRAREDGDGRAEGSRRGRGHHRVGHQAKEAVAEARAAGLELPRGARGLAASLIAHGIDPAVLFQALNTSPDGAPVADGDGAGVPASDDVITATFDADTGPVDATEAEQPEVADTETPEQVVPTDSEATLAEAEVDAPVTEAHSVFTFAAVATYTQVTTVAMAGFSDATSILEPALSSGQIALSLLNQVS